MRHSLILVVLTFFILIFTPIVPVYAGVSISSPKMTKLLSKKKKNRLDRISKRLQSKPKRSFGTLSLFFGIGATILGFLFAIAIILTLFFASYSILLNVLLAVGLTLVMLLGIGAIILSIKSFKKKEEKRGLRLAGLILGAITTLLSLTLSLGLLFQN